MRLVVPKDIMNKKYGSYKLMANYGDNFREGSAYENNDESLFEKSSSRLWFTGC